MTHSPYALIIEDELSLAHVLEISLSISGYRTDIVDDGQEAIDRLLNGSTPDLITLDLNLPSRSGMEILSILRGDERLSNTWVIVTTANTIHAGYLQSSDDPYLIVMIKPISTPHLMQLANRLRGTLPAQT